VNCRSIRPGGHTSVGREATTACWTVVATGSGWWPTSASLESGSGRTCGLRECGCVAVGVRWLGQATRLVTSPSSYQVSNSVGGPGYPGECFRAGVSASASRERLDVAPRLNHMALTPQAVGLHLTVPVHVHQILNDWAPIELGCTPEDVLESLAEELCSNEQLRAFAAGLLLTD
jgi:hypothetical protein